MGRYSKFAMFFAGAALSACPAYAQLTSTLGKEMVQPTEPPPMHPVPLPQIQTNATGEFALAPYERLGPLSNGCNMLMTIGEAGSYGDYKWYGSCRAGLADGEGYLIYKDPSIAGGVQRLQMHLGRVVAFDLPQGTIFNTVIIAMSPMRPTSESISSEDMPVRRVWEKAGDFVGDPGGKTASYILTRSASGDDREMRVDHIWLVKSECPQPYTRSMEKALAESYFGQKLQPELLAKVAPICSKAVSRAKSEGVITDSSSFTISAFAPFDHVDYGYYFLVYLEHTVTARKGNETGYYSGPPSTKVIQSALCPEITSLTGCEAVWRAMQAPFIEKRDAMSAIAPKIAAEDAADRERRAAGSKERLASFAARLSAEASDFAPPPAPEVAAVAAAGKKKP